MSDLDRETVRFLENVGRLHPLISGRDHPMSASALQEGYLEPTGVKVSRNGRPEVDKLRLTTKGQEYVYLTWVNHPEWA